MDLYDQTLADLSRISRSIMDIEELYGSALINLKQELGHCITELRNIVERVRPSVLEVFGIAEAVQQHAEKYGAVHPGICVTVWDELTDETEQLTMDAALGLFRIAQEAINNAFQHSGAKNITVGLTNTQGTITIKVFDDGRGIDGATTCESGGLFYMRTRALLMGAQLDIQSDSGGTQVVLTASLHDEREITVK